jgi:hypothetical protein
MARDSGLGVGGSTRAIFVSFSCVVKELGEGGRRGFSWNFVFFGVLERRTWQRGVFGLW